MLVVKYLKHTPHASWMTMRKWVASALVPHVLPHFSEKLPFQIYFGDKMTSATSLSLNLIQVETDYQVTINGLFHPATL